MAPCLPSIESSYKVSESNADDGWTIASQTCLREALTCPRIMSLRRQFGSSRHPPSADRLERSLHEKPFNLRRFQDEAIGTQQNGIEKDTVLYLAYGSNLCYETFQGRRGIKPLAQMNVLVPELRMTFNLPGMPYTEPCFANTAYRDTAVDCNEGQLLAEKTDEAAAKEYHKDRWKKGMVGVVYEVTPADYAHIIATEGGGTAYHDILVTCYPLETESSIVPEHPTTAPFKAHTLFAPPPASGDKDRFERPDPSYAQASSRYLKLITDGAREHELPSEYMEYLDNLRPYTITTARQQIGQAVVLSFWMPLIMLFFALQRMFQDKKTGRSPSWLTALLNRVVKALWQSYDAFLNKIFGDGERTIGQDAVFGGDSVNRMEKSHMLARNFSGWRGARTADIEGLSMT